MSLPNVQDLYELQKLAGDADMSEMDLTDLRRAFDAFDQDRNGSIDRAELGR
jgi:Ca2+-binding EF-hand superfamily protein